MHWARALVALLRPSLFRQSALGHARNHALVPRVGHRNFAGVAESRKTAMLIWEQAEVVEYELTLADLQKVLDTYDKKEAKEDLVLASAKFLKAHVPPKLAKRIQELQLLPFPFQKDGGSFLEICNMYTESFLQILNAKEPTNMAEEKEFSDMIYQIKVKHLTIRQMVGEAMSNMRCTGSGEWVDPSGKLVYVDEQGGGSGGEGRNKVQDTLTRFYAGRIGVRTLVDQHLVLRSAVLGVPLPYAPTDNSLYVWNKIKELDSQKKPYLTVMHPHCNPKDIVDLAIIRAKDACKDALHACNKSVEVQVEGHLKEYRAFVPPHLYFILFELMTNAILATVKTHHAMEKLPPITVTIGSGPGVFVKISDRGGGMKLDDESKVWKFAISGSGEHKSKQQQHQHSGARQGLALSRLYARYWGGDLKLLSLEGVGCDLLVSLPEKLRDNRKFKTRYPFNAVLEYQERDTSRDSKSSHGQY